MTRTYASETYKRVTFLGDRNVRGFGVYGKSNRNKRETETGLSSRIPRGMFIEDFMEKATGRCVFATKWDLWHKRHDRKDTY